MQIKKISVSYTIYYSVIFIRYIISDKINFNAEKSVLSNDYFDLKSVFVLLKV